MMSLVKKAPVFYYPNFLTSEEADNLFTELSDLNIERHTFNGKKLGRNTAVFGDGELLNNVPPKIWGDNVVIKSWTPIRKSKGRIRRRI